MRATREAQCGPGCHIEQASMGASAVKLQSAALDIDRTRVVEGKTDNGCPTGSSAVEGTVVVEGEPAGTGADGGVAGHVEGAVVVESRNVEAEIGAGIIARPVVVQSPVQTLARVGGQTDAAIRRRGASATHRPGGPSEKVGYGQVARSVQITTQSQGALNQGVFSQGEIAARRDGDGTIAVQPGYTLRRRNRHLSPGTKVDLV